MRCLILLLLFSSFATGFAEENAVPGLGLWSWSQRNFETSDARENLLDFCSREGITHIDQHLSVVREDGGYAVANQEALERLLKEAATRGISVNALRGERAMFFEKNHARAMQQLEAIIRFNRSLSQSARFAGIKYDVEPYLTAEWRAGGTVREKVIADYLSFLHQAQVFLAGQQETLELAVDIPFWWDKPEFSARFNGENKLFIHHIIDLVDWVGIMSYRRDPEELLRLTNEEFAYAKAIGKTRSIAPGINTSIPKGEPAKVSFHGLPPTEFRAALAQLQTKLTGNETARLIMIHDYKSLVNYLSQ